MKNLFIVAVLFFSFQLSYSQGNLQFNTTVYKTLEPVVMTWQIELAEMGTFTVPENKLWKVSIRGSQIQAYTSQAISAIFIKKDDDSNIATVNYSSWYEDTTLGAGTYTVLAAPSDTGSPKGYISIIGTEFNIISE